MLIGKLIKEIAEALLLHLLMINLSFPKDPPGGRENGLTESSFRRTVAERVLFRLRRCSFVAAGFGLTFR
jgi:hypothetical protein